jgi:Tfp pilus assembly protein PilO
MMARSRTERLWVVGGSLAAGLLALLGWLVVVSPKLSSASSLRSEKGTIETDNALLQSKIHKLKDAGANMAQLTQALTDARSALPPDTGLAAFTDQLRAQAATANVSITSITAGAPSVVAAGKAGSAPSTSGTVVPGGLYSIPITLSVTGSPVHDLAFVESVQRGTRAVLVTSSQLATQGSGNLVNAQTTLTLQLQVFSSPQAQQPTQRAQPTTQAAG